MKNYSEIASLRSQRRAFGAFYPVFARNEVTKQSLPPDEDVKKVERQLTEQDKKGLGEGGEDKP